MEHLQENLIEKQIAFIDENNIVINVSVFNEYDEFLIDSVKKHFQAVQFIDCSILETKASIGNEFFNNKFYFPRPSLEHIRDEENGIWVLPLELRLEEETPKFQHLEESIEETPIEESIEENKI
jgi:hypothetical protein